MRGGPRRALTRQQCESVLHLHLSEAARKLGCPHKTLANNVRYYGLTLAEAPSNKKRPDFDTVAKAFECMTGNQAARHFGVQHSTIRLWSEHYGIKPMRADRRNPDEPVMDVTPAMLASVRIRMSDMVGGWNRWAESITNGATA